MEFHFFVIIFSFKAERDGNWTSIYLKMKNGRLLGGFLDNIDPEFSKDYFPVEKWRSMLKTGRVLLGGVEDDFRYVFFKKLID